MSLAYSNLVAVESINSNHHIHYLYANFVRFLEVCKQFAQDLVYDKGNMPKCGIVPKFSDLEINALSLPMPFNMSSMMKEDEMAQKSCYSD